VAGEQRALVIQVQDCQQGNDPYVSWLVKQVDMPKDLAKDVVLLEMPYVQVTPVSALLLGSEEVSMNQEAYRVQAPSCLALHPLSVPKTHRCPLAKVLWVLGRFPVLVSP